MLFTEKDFTEKDIFDIDGCGRGFKNWAILFDNEYSGPQREVCATILEQKCPRKPFSMLEKKKNADIYGERTVIEN